jgi:hypothetical protein
MFMLMIINRLAEFSQKYSSVTSTAFLFYLHLWMMVCFNMQLNCRGSSDWPSVQSDIIRFVCLATDVKGRKCPWSSQARPFSQYGSKCPIRPPARVRACMTDPKQGLAERRVELEHRKKTGRRFSRALSSHLDCKATLVRLGHGSVAYVNSDSGTPAPATRERFCNFWAARSWLCNDYAS